MRHLLVVAFAALLIAIPRGADACSCRSPGDPASELAKSDAVFVATVTSIREGVVPGIWHQVRNALGMEPVFDYGRKVRFSVSQSWKGVTTTTTTVRTGSGGGDCGYDFVVGSSYVVYAYGTDVGFATGICSRTAESTSATDDLAFLGTQPTLALAAPAATAPFRFVIAGALVLCGAAGVAVYLRKRESRRRP